MQKLRTINPKTIATLLVGGFICVFAMGVGGVFAQERCLDYWATGPAKCSAKKPKAQKEPEPEVATPAPVRRAQPSQQRPIEEELTEKEEKEAKLKQDIEQFYDRHGKPPEEFVRFYMEPTPANALAWVKKYNEGLQRSRQLAASWTQAQQIYDQFETQGLELPPELLPEHARNAQNALLPVQDLGVPLPQGLQDSFKSPQELAQRQLQAPQVAQPSQSNDLGFGTQLSVALGADGRIGGNLPPEALTTGGGGAAVAAGGVGAPEDKIKISYYFSAECPFCQKFEPGLRNVIQEQKARLDVTCVDMTPSGQTQANINGKVDCEWRPLLPGEMQAMGVEATPTLIVDRGESKPLERLSGFVDEQRLRTYLFGNQAQR